MVLFTSSLSPVRTYLQSPATWTVTLALSGLTLILLGISPLSISSWAGTPDKVLELLFVGSLIGAGLGSFQAERARGLLLRSRRSQRIQYELTCVALPAAAFGAAALLPCLVLTELSVPIIRGLLLLAHLAALTLALLRFPLSLPTGSIAILLPLLTWILPAMLSTPEPSSLTRSALWALDPVHANFELRTLPQLIALVGPIVGWCGLGFAATGLRTLP